MVYTSRTHAQQWLEASSNIGREGVLAKLSRDTGGREWFKFAPYSGGEISSSPPLACLYIKMEILI